MSMWGATEAASITRTWAMPSGDTFSIAPIERLLSRHLVGRDVIVDPFAKSSRWGSITNDLDPTTTAAFHMDAVEFMRGLADISADAVLVDPPYSPGQIKELYRFVGRTVKMTDTQNARLYRLIKDEADRVLGSGGVVICCGWNSSGMSTKRGYVRLETMLVAHGGAHNDTIITVDRKP